ncbi:hypothetical protein QIS74_10461 [Colletotrichum tabaci]|uniref:Uncharacterized protein n=1 Tax=Colletotrichum tabaci TaxID=1209068 RepID=A0AAV9T0I1_9PEZI
MSIPDFSFNEQLVLPSFGSDVDFLNDPAVPYEEKKWMFDVLLNDVVPYRYHTEPRVFPEINFYITLLYNRPNSSDIMGLVWRFHEFISMMAANHPAEADQVIAGLQLRAMSCGWPGAPTSSAEAQDAQPAEKVVVQPEQAPTPERSPAASPVAARKGRKPNSQLGGLTDHQHPLLKAELATAPQLQYKGVIRDMDHFLELDEAYERHIKRAAGTAPHQDPSWPRSAEQQRVYVRKLVNSITDLKSFYELRKAEERRGKLENVSRAQGPNGVSGPSSRKRKRGDGEQDEDAAEDSARPKGISKTDWILMDEKSTPADRLEAVIHHCISDVEIELLSWRLLRAAMEAQQGFTMRPLWSGSKTVATWEHFNTFGERWHAICANVLDCKIIVHSLTRADWVCKYAGAPAKERGGKLSNDLLNGRRDIQNQVGRDVIKEKTSRQDWTTSEDFEIRDKNGGLVLKGGHLGDRKRRQLAVRSQQSGNP